MERLRYSLDQPLQNYFGYHFLAMPKIVNVLHTVMEQGSMVDLDYGAVLERHGILRLTRIIGSM